MRLMILEREYYQWSSEEKKEITSFFAQWLNGDGLPCMILKFMS
jgi:hypothetical protein